MVMNSDLELWGKCIQNALIFARSSFDIGVELQDWVCSAEIVRTGELFEEFSSGRWFLRQDSIPGDVNVKALGVDRQRLMVETTPVDIPLLRDAVAQTNLLLRIFDDRITSGTGKELVTLRDQQDADAEKHLDARELWDMTWHTLSDDELLLAVRALDLIYRANTFCESQPGDSSDVANAAAVMGKREMRLEMNIQMQLQLEQRPLLALRVETRPEQRMQLQQVMGLQQALLHMDELELTAWIANQLTKPGGEKRAYSALVFTLAGKIARTPAGREMTWPQRRRMARQLMAQGK